MKNIHELPATDQIHLVRSKKISVTELLKDHIRQIEKLEPNIHAWSSLYFDVALRKAGIIDQEISRNEFKGSLWGVSIGVKDIFNTIDMPTEMGSVLWKGFQPGNDARVVSILRTEGAIFPGKTVTAEFAVHAPGPTQNPHRAGYMTGTSSSGSAAAVASCMVPLALGTQSAGSTLRPASYCGIYGFKPSFGLFPRTGMLKTTDTLDHIGLLARTLDDMVLFFETLRVRGENYPIVHRTIDRNKRGKKKKYRVAFVTHPKWVHAEKYAVQAIETYMKLLDKKKDIKVTVVKLPEIFNTVHEIHERIYDFCLAYYFRRESKNPEKLSKPFFEMTQRGRKIPLEQYKEDLVRQDHISKQLDQWFKDYDMAVTLTTGGEAMKGLDTVDRPDSCLIWTFCGVPTLSIPLFTGPTGLPFGLQVIARKYDDDSLLEFAKRFIYYL